MLRIENEYFTLYKSVDAIRRDMFREERHFNGKGEEVFGVSAYIRIMEEEDPSISAVFPEWKDYYKTLKHLRWLRTQIAHSTEVSQCSADDLKDLKSFHSQLLKRTDILARVEQRKAGQARTKKPAKTSAKRKKRTNGKADKNASLRASFLEAALFVIIAAVLVLLLFLLKRPN